MYRKTKLYKMDKANFIVIKTENIYVDIEKDVEGRFDFSNYELERSLHREKIKILWD